MRNRPDAQYLDLEMGADKPGDIKYLIGIAPCRVGILTYISHAHTEYFKTIKRIAQEKRIIISHLPEDGVAVLNFDNGLVMESSSVTKAAKITYGFKEGADLRATDVNILHDHGEILPKGLNFKVNFQGSTVPVFMPGFLSTAIIPAALAGIAVGTFYGINLVESAEALQKIKPLPGHMRPLLGIKNSLIIDDTYNSSPDAAKSAIEVFASLQKNPDGKKIVALGDMLELGPETEHAHREIGFKVVEHGIDFLITVGESSKRTASAAVEAGMSENNVASFASSVEAGLFIQEKIKNHDQILIKGSQGSRMEKIVKEIMAEPLEAKNLLVRQDDYWLKK